MLTINLHLLDISVIGAYFLFVLGIAYWAAGKNKLTSENTKSTERYFLSGKNEGWFVIGASLFASNIGSEIIIGVSGAGARAEMAQANFELLAAIMLIILGWVFVPFYLRSGVFTMPEFLEKRYSSGCRNYLSIVSLLAYIITKISLIIFAGALVFETIGVDFWYGAIIVVLFTGLYTVLGGLKAVIYTDMLQAFILLLGTGCIAYLGLEAVGGWQGLVTTLDQAALKEGNPSKADFFNLWKPASDTSYPWTGMLFGAPILGIWYWCTDQFIVQRTLSAKDITNARRGALFAGFLKLLPVFLFFFPGVLAYALYQQGSLHFSLENPDHALPAMIGTLLPIGLKGLAISALLAALMSSLSSAFNSSSTLITLDFYKKCKKNTSEKELVWAGQIATLVLVVISLAWIPFMQTLMQGGIFHYLQSIQAYISPPIAAVFLMGLCFQWVNAKGAMSALWFGFIVGMTRLVMEYLSKEGIIEPAKDGLLAQFLAVNFLHFAFLLFVFSVLVLLVVSKIAPMPITESVKRLTFANSESNKVKFCSTDGFLTLLLVLLLLSLWVIFSPWGVA